MSEFNDLELNKDIADMEADEARETLSDFMEAHQKNRTVYDELQTEFSETKEEYEDKLDGRDERIAEFKEQRAEEASQYVNMPAELLADRFDFSELDQIIEEAEEADAEFAEEGGEPEEEDESDQPLTEFSDKGGKGRVDGGGTSKQARDRARSALSNKNFPIGE